MTMTDNVPGWLTPVAWIFIASAVVTATLIALDIHRRGRRHDSVASELVWITSALYLGPFALPLYSRHGRAASAATGTDSSPAVGGLPGGAASAIAHLIGVPLVLASGLTIAGIDLWVMILVIGALAMLILFAFERTTVTSSSRCATTPTRTWATSSTSTGRSPTPSAPATNVPSSWPTTISRSA